MNAPIFIVGANRSGTTLLRLLLNAHSDVAIPDELNYFYGFTASEVCYENWEQPQLSSSDYRQFVERFLDANRANVSELDLNVVRRDILDGPQDFRRPYQILLEHWARQFGKHRWGEKTPGNIYHSNILIDMFPDALFIHMIRDPRGGVASMQRVPFFGDDVTLNALYRHKIMTHGREWLKDAVPARQRTEIRYEDLVRDPEEVLKRICRFVDVPYERQMLAFHTDANRFMIDEAASSYNATATRPISEERATRWRQELKNREIAIVESICESEMREFGYPLLNLPLPWWDVVKVGVKRTYWWLQWLRHRQDRHFLIVTPIFAQIRARLRTLKTRLKHRYLRVISAWH